MIAAAVLVYVLVYKSTISNRIIHIYKEQWMNSAQTNHKSLRILEKKKVKKIWFMQNNFLKNIRKKKLLMVSLDSQFVGNFQKKRKNQTTFKTSMSSKEKQWADIFHSPFIAPFFSFFSLLVLQQFAKVKDWALSHVCYQEKGKK